MFRKIAKIGVKDGSPIEDITPLQYTPQVSADCYLMSYLAELLSQRTPQPKAPPEAADWIVTQFKRNHGSFYNSLKPEVNDEYLRQSAGRILDVSSRLAEKIPSKDLRDVLLSCYDFERLQNLDYFLKNLGETRPELGREVLGAVAVAYMKPKQTKDVVSQKSIQPKAEILAHEETVLMRHMMEFKFEIVTGLCGLEDTKDKIVDFEIARLAETPAHPLRSEQPESLRSMLNPIADRIVKASVRLNNHIPVSNLFTVLENCPDVNRLEGITHMAEQLDESLTRLSPAARGNLAKIAKKYGKSEKDFKKHIIGLQAVYLVDPHNRFYMQKFLEDMLAGGEG
ncbi:MAG: hypothetical protein V1744_06330 [Candidatus Altiarchaeota archaeon]